MATMDLNHQLPFKVGQQAEFNCFTEGYRGAWFRCKIQSISFRKRHIGASLEFFDYPEEKIKWTKLYEKPPRHSVIPGRGSKKQLMLRPCFPPFYHESQMPDIYAISDVIVIADHFWEVGDLVDWWYEGCYWSARVTHLLGNDKVQLELPEPPIGEGKSYEASSSDLRPSLDWSLEHGWTVPVSREIGSCRYCARLVHPLNEGKQMTDKNLLAENTTDKEREGNCTPMDSRGSGSLETQTSSSSNLFDSSFPLNGHVHPPIVPSSGRVRYNSRDFTKKMRISEDGRVTSIKHAGTIESSIMELEELANKIRWLKGLLHVGFQWSNMMKPSWKFLEARGS